MILKNKTKEKEENVVVLDLIRTQKLNEIGESSLLFVLNVLHYHCSMVVFFLFLRISIVFPV